MRLLTSLLLIIGLLYLITTPVSAQVIISGAGTAAVNGTYSYLGSYGGRPMYRDFSSPGANTIMWDATYWRMMDGSGNPNYYTNSANTILPPDSGWVAEVGEAPAPTLSPYFAAPSGSGTVDDPYLIGSLANLVWISAKDAQVPSPNRAARWAAYYKQTADIEAIETSYGGFWDAGWVPIGNWDLSFSGTFDGDRHTIHGLTIDRAEEVQAMFGALSGSCGIYRLGLTAVSMTGTRFCSALAGVAIGTIAIDECYSTGTVNATQFSGGLIAYFNQGSLSHSYSTCTMTSTDDVCGGLIGAASDAAISDCYATGNIQTIGFAGGMIGECSGTTSIIRSYTTGDITSASGFAIGGFIGHLADATISQCYSRGNITGGMRVGGFIGTFDFGTVNDSYATGSATALNGEAGGFTGHLGYGTMDHCYSTGMVSGSTKGGLVGVMGSATVTNSYWDMETSDAAVSAGGTGKYSWQMKYSATYAGWSMTIWTLDAGFNDGYPALHWQNPSGTQLTVELSSFTADIKGHSVELHWSTATEQNNHGFEVQRRETEDWVTLGSIAGHGTTNVPQSYSFVDGAIHGMVRYRLKQIDNDGSISYSKTIGSGSVSPSRSMLEQNYPNPFNPVTTIRYSLPVAGFVTLKVYNILGTEVATLIHNRQEAGINTVPFDASTLSSGIFYARLNSGGYTNVIKMMLVK